MSDLDFHPYFRNKKPSEWNCKEFLAEINSNQLYLWTKSLKTIETQQSNSPELLCMQFKAQALLNADSLQYFDTVDPADWCYADFAKVYGRNTNRWTWALNERMTHVTNAVTFTARNEFKELKRCFDSQNDEVSQEPKKAAAKEPATKKRGNKRARHSSTEPTEPETINTYLFHRNHWILRTGTCVEDALLGLGKLSQLLILDVNSQKQITKFNSEERLEIESYLGSRELGGKTWEVPELPQDKCGLISLAKDFIDCKDERSRWLATALVNLSSIYLNPLLSQPIGEIGFACIWSTILDTVLLDSGWYISRGEQESLVEKMFREEPEQYRTGHDSRNPSRFDGIIKGYHEVDATRVQEYGYIEVAKEKQLQLARKRLDDEFKMLRAMRISLLHQRGKDMEDDEWLKLLRISVFSSGLQLRIIHMTPGKGSVFLVRRLPIVTLPEQYDAKLVRTVLQEIAYFRALLTGQGFLDGSLDGSLVGPVSKPLDGSSDGSLSRPLDESLAGSLGGSLGGSKSLAGTDLEEDWVDGSFTPDE